MNKYINSAYMAKLLVIAAIASAVYITAQLAINRDTSTERLEDSASTEKTVSPSPATTSRLQNGAMPDVAHEQAGLTMPGKGATEPSAETVEKDKYTSGEQLSHEDDIEIDQYIYHPQHIERFVALVPLLDDPDTSGYLLVPTGEAGITFLKRLGLEPGDLVMSYDGIPLHSEDEAQRFIRGFQNPEDMGLVINRKGNVVPVIIQLGQ